MNKNAINELLETLKIEFLATLPERLAEIESLVLALPDDADVASLLRVVHSLKGAAGTHGCHIFTKICHQMEDMMRELTTSYKIHSQNSVEVLLEYNDLQNTALDLFNNNDDNFSVIDSKLTLISQSQGQTTLKVLVVEPSPLYASIIISVLESETIHVKIVSDGFVALENLLMQFYDAVITAMEVPTLNGDALLSAVRLSQSKNKDINAILITTKDVSSIKNSTLFNHIVNRTFVNDGNLSVLLES